MRAHELIQALKQSSETFPTAEVIVEGWDASGDMQQFRLKGDFRMERDGTGMPVIVIR